jgi:hypothetical protein
MKVARFAPLLAALVLMACLPAVSQANLVVQGNVVDNVNEFHALLVWSAAGTDPAVFPLGGMNWSVNVLTSIGGQLVSTSAQHLLPTPGPVLTTLNHPVVPGGTSDKQTVTAGSDSLTVFVTARGDDSLIHIDAHHMATTTPEPTSAATWIFAGGSLLFAARRRFRRG